MLFVTHSTAPLSIGNCIKFQNFGPSSYIRKVDKAFRSLHLAKSIRPIYPNTATSPPLIPNLKKSPKRQLLD